MCLYTHKKFFHRAGTFGAGVGGRSRFAPPLRGASGAATESIVHIVNDCAEGAYEVLYYICSTIFVQPTA